MLLLHVRAGNSGPEISPASKEAAGTTNTIKLSINEDHNDEVTYEVLHAMANFPWFQNDTTVALVGT